ncbi:hypothetical protein COOONC_18229 [Cooperia oncophora]
MNFETRGNKKEKHELLEGQDGEIEGLNQDTWVATYIAQIKSALASIEYPYHILCKGDDVTVCFAIPPTIYETSSMAEIRDDLVNRIASTLGELGHTIKTEESYGSETYFAFSKAASIASIELPQTLRKIQKVYGATNAFVATFDEYIGSAFSNAHSACKVSSQTCSQFLVACDRATWHILSTPAYSQLTDQQLLACLLVPNMLGGSSPSYTFIICLNNGCQEVDVFDHQSYSCKKSVAGELCTVDTLEIVKINPFKQEACLRLTSNSTSLLEVKLLWKALDLICEKETVMFTRNTTYGLLDSKRCPHKGLCVGQKCGEVTSFLENT